MKSRKKRGKGETIEIRRGMRSLPFIRLLASVTHTSDLLTSVHLYNDFPHALAHDLFFEFTLKKYNEDTRRSRNERPADYVMRLDLGRNIDFLSEVCFLHMCNAFITYCSDILAVAVLGSPEKFRLPIRFDTKELGRTSSREHLAERISLAAAERILSMNYPDVKKLLLSSINLDQRALKRFQCIDQHVRKRNQITHRLGVSNWAIDLSESNRVASPIRATEKDLLRLWRDVRSLSVKIDTEMMRRFDIWRGVDMCAPGLFRKKGGNLLRPTETYRFSIE